MSAAIRNNSKLFFQLLRRSKANIKRTTLPLVQFRPSCVDTCGKKANGINLVLSIQTSPDRVGAFSLKVEAA